MCGVAGAGQVRQENLDPDGEGYYSLEAGGRIENEAKNEDVE